MSLLSLCGVLVCCLLLIDLERTQMPDEYINWTVPEGGGGPAYTIM